MLSLYIAETFITEEATLCSLHTIDKEWKEMEVTWNDAMTDTPWKMQPATHNDDSFALVHGGDIEIDPIDSPLSNGVDEWQEFNITSAIKDFIENPENNNGFMIRNSSEQQPHIYFSSEYEDINKRPKLTFKISTPITNLYIKNKTGINIRSINNFVEITTPFKNSYCIEIFSLNGKKVVNLSINKKKKAIIRIDAFSLGVNIISITENSNTYNFKLFRSN